MKKVWLVTRGEYSDYRVVGAFSTEKNATKFAAHFNTDSNSVYSYEVEEYFLNPCTPEVRKGLNPFVVHMKRNGDIVYSGTLSGPWEPSTSLDTTSWEEPRLMVTCWAKDLKHAIKITNEKRIQIIAANEWPEKGWGTQAKVGKDGTPLN